jgi:uncharacterized protein
VPDAVLGQLGNRVQHTLRAFTPRDQKVIKATAENFRVNTELDAAAALTELGVGEALVSFLNEKGQPTVVQRAFVLPPHSQIGPLSPEERQAIVAASLVAGVYDTPVDRESAYELLLKRAEEAQAAQAQAEAEAQAQKEAEAARKEAEKAERQAAIAAREAEREAEKAEREAAQAARAAEREAREAQRELERQQREQQRQMEQMTKGAFRFLNSRNGQAVVRGLFGSLLGGKK